jgi:hypothetical protein
VMGRLHEDSPDGLPGRVHGSRPHQMGVGGGDQIDGVGAPITEKGPVSRGCSPGCCGARWTPQRSSTRSSCRG